MRKICLTVLLAIFVVYITLMPAQAEKGGKLVALTFDDGPSGKYTETLLDGLQERGVKVTFFVLGQNAQRYPEIIRRAYEEGHEIGCHSWNHPDLTELGDEKILAQFQDSFAVLDELCGQQGNYLIRPPYGNTDERVRALLDSPLICWSVDSRDWEYLDAEKVREQIVKDAYDGAIILCHDIHSTTIPAALEAIDLLMEEGYEFVTVSELFRRRDVQMEAGKLYYNCRPNGTDLGPVEVVETTVPTETAAPETTESAPQEKELSGGGGGWGFLCLIPLVAVLLALLRHGQTSEEARSFLNRCGEASQLQFRADISSRQSEMVKKLTLDCVTEPDGAVSFTVIRPERIAGVSGSIGADEGKLFRPDGGLRTVASPWMLLHALRCGKLQSCTRRKGILVVQLAAWYNREPVPVELHIRKGKLLSAQLHWREQRIYLQSSRFYLEI